MSLTAPEPTTASRGGEPTVAVLLTWLVPGAGHLYLGRHVFGFCALAVVGGLYWLGFQLSDGLFLEYLPAEMRGRFAGALTPEVGNLGGLLLHLKSSGYQKHPIPWPESMDLGTTLTSASGILNLLLMSKAHLDARLPQGKASGGLGPAELAVATWLVPGLGHFLQGRRLRGLLLGAGLILLFLLGTLLAEGSNLDRERHFYYWAGQFLLGLPAICTEFLFGHPMIREEVAYADAGVVMSSIAGMLNILLILDVYGFQEARLLGTDPPVRADAKSLSSGSAKAPGGGAASAPAGEESAP